MILDKWVNDFNNSSSEEEEEDEEENPEEETEETKKMKKKKSEEKANKYAKLIANRNWRLNRHEREQFVHKKLNSVIPILLNILECIRILK